MAAAAAAARAWFSSSCIHNTYICMHPHDANNNFKLQTRRRSSTSSINSTNTFTWDDVTHISQSQPLNLHAFLHKVKLCNRGAVCFTSISCFTQLQFLYIANLMSMLMCWLFYCRRISMILFPLSSRIMLLVMFTRGKFITNFLMLIHF